MADNSQRKYEEKYECFRSEETCNKKLRANKKLLINIQNGENLKTPYCKSESKTSNTENLLTAYDDLSLTDSPWYKFW
jgi:hypothetical protein